MSTIDDRLNADYARAWRPGPGDKLVGKVIEISERLGYDDEPYPIVTVQPDSGEPLAVHAFHTVLRNELARQRPQIGETLGIKYEGQVATESGRGTYHRYRVRVDRAQQAFSWSRYGDDESGSESPAVPQDQPGRDDTDDIPF